jgi:ABC-2 type transport system ATP-binding protein
MTGLSVRTTDLGVTYGSTSALEGVTLDLGANRIHGLLGRNGAGKTTLLSVLASMRPPTTGSVLVDGADPFENEALMEQVCLIRESGDLLAEEKVRTNLDWFEMARPAFDRAYAERLLEESRVDLGARPSRLSRGQRSAVGAAIGLATRAPVTMFDEVHLGMDAPSRERFYQELLTDYAAHPRTIILSSHLINEVEPLLETVTVLHEGRTVLAGEESDVVRTRGATLTGPARLVDELTSGRPVLGVRDLGPTRQAVLFGDLDPEVLERVEREGVRVGPLPLQDLVIHLTESTPTPKERP